MDEAMKQLLASTPLRYDINRRFVQVYNPKIQSRQDNMAKLIRGTVVDENDEPLVGVVVRDKASNRGTITDIDGHFRFEVSDREKTTLIASYIGKKTLTYSLKGKDSANLHLTLQDDNQVMDEVVVTGYQQLDRRHLTSAITSVKMDDIQMPGVTDLSRMLEGKIPDLIVTSNSSEVNSTPHLRIRGTSTIIGNREPLWVVDGIIMTDPVSLSPDVPNDPDYINRIGNAISGLNPQDIERLDVLKDAAATALYGTRAANGVIVITTKKGRAGKPVVSYSVTGTFRQRPRYTDRRIDVMNSQERIRFSQDLVSMHYIYPYGMPLVGYEYALSNLYNGTYTEEQFQAEVARMQTMNTDWFDLLTHDSFSQDHNVNVSGGSEALRYYASLGYTDEDDVINNTTNRRYTATAKLDLSLSQRLQLSFNINGYLNDRKYAQSSINPINYAYNTSRAIPAMNEDGTYAFYQRYTNNGYRQFNILNELDNSYQKQNTNGVTATVNLHYNATDWLSLNGILSASATNANLEGYWGEQTFHVAELRRSDYGETPPSESELPYGGELSKQGTRNKNYMARIQANINKYLGDDKMHYLNIAIGGEANSTHYESYSDTERGYYRNRGRSFVSNLSVDDFPNYTTWLLGNVPTIEDQRTNLLSAYATASYSYGNYFTLNANTRYDGSNQFGSRSNEKLLPVWSVSGMANLNSILHLTDKWKWLDVLTLKASYGEQGNMLDGQTPELVIRKGSMSDYYGEMYSTVSSFANPDLQWEKTRSTNVGVEASLWGGRLMLGFEYYYKKTTDAFMDKPISDVNGFDSYVVNSGTVVNRGYNVNITATPVRIKDFNWLFSGSLSRVFNEMHTAPGTETYDLDAFLNGTAVVQGQPIGTFWSYRFLGLSPADGGPLFDDWEERQSELENMSQYEAYTHVLVPSGQREPNITGSINNTFSYKAWRLNIGLYYSLGANTRLFRLFDNFVSGYSAETNINRDILNAWRGPSDELTTDIPAIMGQGSNGYYHYNTHWSSSNLSYSGPQLASNAWDMYDYSDIRVVSADYLKIQSVSLTYEVPQQWLSSHHLQRLAVTLGATNLYTFCNKRLRGQTPTQGGFSEVQLSDTPTYSIGLSLNF